jgi:uncharacterized membrane protein YozB (DUF420 family)
MLTHKRSFLAAFTLTILFLVTVLAFAQDKKDKEKLPDGCGEGQVPVWQEIDPVTAEPTGV